MQRMLPIIAVNGVIDAQVSPLDRGFAYGDGVFETCRLLHAKIPLWNLHKERLLKSCEKLSIPIALESLEAQLENLVSQAPTSDIQNAVIKITVTRGEGGRGYRISDISTPTIVIGIFPGAQYPASYFSNGVNVRLCQQRLSCNPSLAGLKHLNRLEQVLARAEWHDENIAEGIVFDTKDNLIEGVFSNVFLIKNNKLLTPDLSEAGVAGVMRRFIIETIAPKAGLTTEIKALNLDELLSAEAIFLCNSLYGIWPVIKIEGRKNYPFECHKITQTLQRFLNEALSLNEK